jgi:hypothetical protein
VRRWLKGALLDWGAFFSFHTHPTRTPMTTTLKARIYAALDQIFVGTYADIADAMGADPDTRRRVPQNVRAMATQGLLMSVAAPGLPAPRRATASRNSGADFCPSQHPPPRLMGACSYGHRSRNRAQSSSEAFPSAKPFEQNRWEASSCLQNLQLRTHPPILTAYPPPTGKSDPGSLWTVRSIPASPVGWT